MDKIIPSDDPRRRLHYATTDSLVGSLDNADRPWLETALADESLPEQRAVVLYALISDLRARGQDPSDLETIRRKLGRDTALGRILTECTAPSDRDEKRERMEREWRDEARVSDDQEAQCLEGWKKWRAEMLADPSDAFSPVKLRVTMDNLYRWLCAAKPSRNRYGLWDKETLTEAFDPKVVNSAETALRAFWRTTVPILWSQRPADDWIYGLQGLLAEASTPGWTAALSACRGQHGSSLRDHRIERFLALHLGFSGIASEGSGGGDWR